MTRVINWVTKHPESICRLIGDHTQRLLCKAFLGSYTRIPYNQAKKELHSSLPRAAEGPAVKIRPHMCNVACACVELTTPDLEEGSCTRRACCVCARRHTRVREGRSLNLKPYSIL